MDNVNNHLFLRKVINTDDVLLFKWANDPSVREWSFNKDPILFNEHKIWFKKMLKDSNVLIWIFEDHNSPIGMVRLENNNNKVLLNYLIAPQSRGKKFATKMLKMAINEVKSYWQNVKLYAYTLSDNIASIKSLEKAGFYLENSSDDKNCYVFNIMENIGTTLE